MATIPSADDRRQSKADSGSASEEPHEADTGCCSAVEASTAPEGDMSGGCHSTSKQQMEGDIEPSCCDDQGPSSSAPEPESPSIEDPDNPTCCDGTTSDCCDDACLDRVALRDCGTSGDPATLGSTPPCDGRDKQKPCESHANAVRERYAITLEAIGCICRALLQLGQESCCLPKDKRKQRQRRSAPSHIFVDSCIATGSRAGAGSTKTVSLRSNKSGRAASREAPKGFTETSREIRGTVTDPEMGLFGKERVILSVSGLTCTGCESKLHRALAAVTSVSNLKTSLVMARAEFDVDLSSGSADEVIRHIHRTTEFKAERVSIQGSSVDILVPGNPIQFVDQEWPVGVTDMTVVDKKTVCVAFDSEVIGARDLVQRGWDTPMRLAPPRSDPSLEAGSKHVRKVGYMTLLSTILTIPVVVMAWAPLPERELEYSTASMALATLVQIFIAGPFYPNAIKSLIFSKLVEMDLLIVLSTSAAYIFSVVSFGYLVAGQPLSTGEFFETSTLLVTLIMVGRYVSSLARQKAIETISIRSLQTPTATLVDGDFETEIDCRLLQHGDIFKVAPDSRVPTDGTVLSGSSEVDESMLTGEAMPVEKYAKSAVIAGSINSSGSLIVRLTRLPGDNTISTIAGMVDEAKISRPRIQDITDRVASYFVPVVVLLSALTFAVWIGVGIGVRKLTGGDAATEAITYAITVLIVSCPCAIGLAVPMVIVVATGIAAERGIIFKSADSIEVAYKTSHVVFDKTGTLTQGKLAVTAEIYPQPADADLTKARLLGLLGSIKHPVSAAVSSHLRENGVSALTTVTDVKTLTGKGVEGTSEGLVLRAGNSRWLDLSSSDHVQSILARGHTAFCFTVDGSLAAVFGLTDSLREDSLSTVGKLQEAGVTVHIVSGDDDGAVTAVASQLGIPSSCVKSRATPADKQSYVQSLLDTQPPSSAQTQSRFKVFARREGRQAPQPIVMFCGDGTNDAVALAQATIGVHINEGTDVARSAADVVLMRPALSGVLGIMAVSKMSVHRIAFNFGWSFLYNLLAVLLAAGAFVGARIPPEYAGLGELVSVLPVIAAAVLMRWAKF